MGRRSESGRGWRHAHPDGQVVVMRHGKTVGCYGLDEVDARRILVSGDVSVPSGKPVRVAVQLEDERAPIELTGRVVRTTPTGGGRVTLSIELAHVAPAIEDRLQEAALHALVSELRPRRPAD